MAKTCFFLILSTFCLLLVDKGDSSTPEEVEQFISDTITSRWYRPEVFPRSQQSDTIVVSLQFQLAAIKDFDEVSGTIELIGELTIDWTDNLINNRYDPSVHGNMSFLLVSSSSVWKPSVTTFNSVSNIIEVGDTSNRVRISLADGAMQWGPGIVTKTGCPVDVSNFPFDKQTCNLTFVNWGWYESEVYFAMPSSEIDLTGYRENEEWSIDSTTAIVESSAGISYARFSLQLTRRSLFFLSNLVFPILVLSLLNAIVFLLPPATGERISYTITAFMSFAVYLTLTADNLPRTSEPMSILCVYLMVMTCLSAGTALFTIFTLRIFHSDEEQRVPDKLATIIGCLNCRVCKDEDDEDDDLEMFAIKDQEPEASKEVPKDIVDGDGNEKAPLPDDEEFEEENVEKEKEVPKGKYGVDYKLVSATLDFLFFLAFCALNALITFFFLVPLATAMNS